jgi:hypothetical protein
VAFNSQDEAFCSENQIAYINLDQESLGRDGLVKKRLLNKNMSDHHYDKIQYVKLIAPKMKQFV